MHVNNEIGTILDIDHVAHLCEANQAYFHTDAQELVQIILLSYGLFLGF